MVAVPVQQPRQVRALQVSVDRQDRYIPISVVTPLTFKASALPYWLHARYFNDRGN